MSADFFAASNSAEGFVNYFPRIFTAERCRRIFVVKGGPGTGKSYFMRQVAEAAESGGHEVTYYYCSSDPESLDGIIVEDMGIGFVDGTAPHVWEPASVGTFEQLINLGDFWDIDVLASRRATIEALGREKKRCYGQAYRYLSAAGTVRRAMLDEMRYAVNEEKMRRAVSRTIEKLDCVAGDVYREEVALCDSVGMMGRVRKDNYEKTAKRRYFVKDVYGISALFFGEFQRLCQRQSVGLRISYDPLLPEQIDAIAPMGTDCVFSLAECEDSVVINLQRFIKTDAYKMIRASLKEKKAAAESLEAFAVQALAAVREYHFAIEQLFTDAMDFSAKESFTTAFCTKLFATP